MKTNILIPFDSLSAHPFQYQHFLTPYGLSTSLTTKQFKYGSPCQASERKIIATSSPQALWTKRPKLSDKKSFYHHFSLKQFLLTVIKQFVLVVSVEVIPQLIEFQQQLKDAIENGEEDDDDLTLEIDWSRIFDSNFPRKVAFAIFRFLSLESMQRYTEEQLLKICSVKTVDRLIRDPMKSAIVKASKHGKLGASWRMLRTGFYSNCLLSSACFVFDSATIAVQEAHKRSQNQQASFKHVCKKIGTKAYLCFLRIGGYVLGGSVGTACWPGKGTLIGIVLGECAVDFYLPIPVFLRE